MYIIHIHQLFHFMKVKVLNKKRLMLEIYLIYRCWTELRWKKWWKKITKIIQTKIFTTPVLLHSNHYESQWKTADIFSSMDKCISTKQKKRKQKQINNTVRNIFISLNKTTLSNVHRRRSHALIFSFHITIYRYKLLINNRHLSKNKNFTLTCCLR